MDRSEIFVGRVVFFTKEGIKHYGKILSGVPLTVIEVEPESYQGSMDIRIQFSSPICSEPRTLWIHSSRVCSGEHCLSDEALDMFMSEF